MPQLEDALDHKPSPPQVFPPTERPAAEPVRHRLSVAVYSMLAVALSIYLLDRLSSILQPLFIALFILYALLPVKNWLRRHGVPGWAAYGLILGCVLAVLVTLGTLAYNNLYQLNPDNLGRYEAATDRHLNSALDAVGLASEEPLRVRELVPGREKLSFPDAVVKASGSFFGFLVAAAVVVVYLFFLLLEMAEFPARVREAFGSERAGGALDVAEKINDAVGSYLSVLAFVSLLQGALSSAVLGGLGIDFYLLWGLVIAACNLVPYVGLFAVGLPVALAFVQYPDQPWRGVTALILLAGIQAVVDNVVTPRLTAHKLGVSPLLVLLSVAFWGWLWGPVGLVLAVPLTASLKIVLEQVPMTKPIAVLMKDH